VKWARPPVGASSDVSTLRKLRSFEVEAAFYRTLAPRCERTCRVATLLASRESAADREWVLVLEDLDAAGYDLRADEANHLQLDGALAWLAHRRRHGRRVAAACARRARRQMYG
jgi:hypothetical protein